jgi:hypothetical protein
VRFSRRSLREIFYFESINTFEKYVQKSLRYLHINSTVSDRICSSIIIQQSAFQNFAKEKISELTLIKVKSKVVVKSLQPQNST